MLHHSSSSRLDEGFSSLVPRYAASASRTMTEIDQSGSRSVFRQCDSLSSNCRIGRGKVTVIFAKSSFSPCGGLSASAIPRFSEMYLIV